MAATPLSVEAYLTLAAIGWLDGRMEPDEARAIERVAIAEGLPEPELERVREALRTKSGFGDLSALNPPERLYVYAMAFWVARVDGQISEREAAALDAVTYVLGLRPKARSRVEDIVARATADGAGVDRLDLVGLRHAVQDGLLNALTATSLPAPPREEQR